MLWLTMARIVNYICFLLFRPRKHPVTFKMSQLAVLNKVDVAKAMDIDINEVISGANALYPQLEIIPTSAKTGIGMDILAKKLGLIKQ